MQALCRELPDESKPPNSRRLAGINLKNALTSKVFLGNSLLFLILLQDDEQAEKLANDWKSLPEAVRNEIKDASVRALGAGNREVRNTAAQVVSKIATIELPSQMWPQLMQTLIVFVTQAEPSPAGQEKKESTLACIGYICEEMVRTRFFLLACSCLQWLVLISLFPQAMLETDVLETQSSAILTAVVAGMRKEEVSVPIKLSATRALLNALDFIKRNFEVVVSFFFVRTSQLKPSQPSPRTNATT